MIIIAAPIVLGQNAIFIKDMQDNTAQAPVKKKSLQGRFYFSIIFLASKTDMSFSSAIFTMSSNSIFSVCVP